MHDSQFAWRKNVFLQTSNVASSNIVEIIDSGIIEVTEEANDDGNESEGEGELYNTDNEPYRNTLSDDDSITVNSS